MRYRPSLLGDYSKLGWDASYRGATWTSECSEASVRKNTYSTSAAESTEYNFKHTPGVGAHVGKVHTGIPRCTRHKGALTAQNTNRHRRGAKFRVTGH